MDFFVEKSDLLKELNFVRSAVEKRTTIPILSHFLLETEGFELKITATDLEVAVRTVCQAKIRTKGAAVIPALRFLDIVRSAPESEIRCRALDNNWVQVTYQRSSFKVVGLAKDNFPKLPSVPKPITKVDAELLAACVERTSFAMSTEEGRFVLNGALLKLHPDAVTMVATDGHRLALVERRHQSPGLTEEVSLLVPRKALLLLRRLPDEGGEGASVELSKDKSHVFFTLGSRLLVSRVLTGQFPNYESVLPKENGKVVELDREALEAVVRRVALLADDRLHGIRLALGKNQLDVSASSPEYGEAKEVVEARCEQRGCRSRRVVAKAEQFEGKENPRYVVTSLAAEQWSAQALYERLYCARGEMENRIQEQLSLFSDRLSTETMRANQLRLYFSAWAYVLIDALRRLGLAGTEWACAQVETIWLRLLKIAAQVRLSARRIWVCSSSAYSWNHLCAAAWRALRC
jgi:DNA polymerase-3 subunit beta